VLSQTHFTTRSQPFPYLTAEYEAQLLFWGGKLFKTAFVLFFKGVCFIPNAPNFSRAEPTTSSLPAAAQR
jgi:hypothetical protein